MRGLRDRKHKGKRRKGRTAAERIGKGSGCKGRQIPQSTVQVSAGNTLLWGIVLGDTHKSFGLLKQRVVCSWKPLSHF